MINIVLILNVQDFMSKLIIATRTILPWVNAEHYKNIEVFRQHRRTDLDVTI